MVISPEQRIYTAISGGVPDRVPLVPKIWVDLAANLTGTYLCEVIENPLTALRVITEAGVELGVDGVRQFHLPARRTILEDNILYEVDRSGRRLGRIDIQGGLSTHLDDPADFKLEDPYKMAHYQFWSCSEPFVKNLRDAGRIRVPEKHFYEEIGCGERQRKIQELIEDRVALIGDCSSATLAFYVSLRGLNNALTDLIDRPDLAHAVMEKGVAIAVEKGKFNIDLGLRILRLNDSVANMNVISPKHWREFILPHMKEVCAELHNYDSQVRIYCHICGDILPIVEDLVNTGIDCIAPLDPLGGFTCGQVREKVQDRVSLMGGINTLSFLNSTPEEIVAEARKCMLEAGVKGGFILGSGCVIPRSAKKENLKALVEAVKDYGIYQNGKLSKINR